MTKTISFNDRAYGVTASERDDVLAAADNWHDPANGQVVVHVDYRFPPADGQSSLTIQARMEEVDVDNVQTVRDNLAGAIDGLPLDFGTVSEIKEAIDIE